MKATYILPIRWHDLDRRFAAHVLGCWNADRTSLLEPVASPR